MKQIELKTKEDADKFIKTQHKAGKSVVAIVETLAKKGYKSARTGVPLTRAGVAFVLYGKKKKLKTQKTPAIPKKTTHYDISLALPSKKPELNYAETVIALCKSNLSEARLKQILRSLD